MKNGFGFCYDIIDIIIRSDYYMKKKFIFINVKIQKNGQICIEVFVEFKKSCGLGRKMCFYFIIFQIKI